MANKIKPLRGRVYKRRRRDPRDPARYIESKNWWIQYYRGRQVRKPTETEDYREAVKILNKQLELINAGKLMPVEAEHVKFEDLEKLIVRDYNRNKRKSLERAQRGITHLERFFGGARAGDISTSFIDDYIDYRMDVDKASNSTVRYEMSLLKRMFHLAENTLGRVPRFPAIRVSNTRKGFFEESEFRLFLEHFDEDLKPMLQFAYLTGWRMQSEIFTLKWPQVDFTAGEVRLYAGMTKTDEGRVFPFKLLPELDELLRAQKESTDRLRREKLIIIPWVFHKNGKKLTDIRWWWDSALEKSGIGKKIPHDFRRTAVRNLERAGVPRSVAMKLVGHKTEAIYRRYAIVAPQDLEDGMKRLASFREQMKKDDPGTVVPIKKEGKMGD